MEAGINQKFYLYYGNNAVSSCWNPEDVWEDSAVMVQHMADNPDNTHITDSTQYDNDGTKKGANEPIETANGKIDGAQSFDGVDDLIEASSQFGDVDFISIPFTISAIIKSQNDNKYMNVINIKPLTGTNNGIQLVFDTVYHRVCFIFRKVDLSNQIPFMINTASFSIVNNTFYHVIITYDGNGTPSISTVKFYIDGLIKTNDITNTGTGYGSNNMIRIGGTSGKYFQGVIDEIRIYDDIKSAEWIKADYNSGADTLLIYGAEELCLLALTILYNTGINKLYINGTERANNTTIYIDKNVNVNATVTLKPNFIFMKYALSSIGASLLPTYIFNMTNPFTLWSYATPNFFIYEEPTTFTFTHWLILLFIALVISLLAAIKFHIIATVSLILVLYMVINVASYTGIILLAIIVWLLTIMFSIIAFAEI